MAENTAEISKNQEPPTVFLSKEARKDAKGVAKKVWIGSMKFLEGGNYTVRQSTDPRYATIRVRGEEALKEEDFWKGKGVDLIVDRISGQIDKETGCVVESYVFYKRDRGYVIKETFNYPPKGKDLPENVQALERHEANAEELGDLLASMKKTQEMSIT